MGFLLGGGWKGIIFVCCVSVWEGVSFCWMEIACLSLWNGLGCFVGEDSMQVCRSWLQRTHWDPFACFGGVMCFDFSGRTI